MFHTGLGVHLPLYTYIAVLLGCCLSFARPVWGMYVLALILPLQSGRFRIREFPLGNRAIELLIIAIIIGLLVSGRSFFPPKQLRLRIGLLCLAMYFSLWIGPALRSDVPWPIAITAADGFHTPFGYWYMFMHLPVLFLLVCATVKDKRQMQILLFCMMIAFLWVSKDFYGNQSHRNMEIYTEALRARVGLDFGGSNGRAAFAVQGTLFLIGMFGVLKSWRIRFLAAGLIAAGIYSVVFSYSRGAYVAFALGLLYLAIFRIRWLLIPVIVMMLAGTTILPRTVLQRIDMTYQGGELDASSESRLDLWHFALNTTLRDPVFGIGFDSFRFYRQGENLQDTHNMYMKALVETGVVGFGCFVALLVSAFTAGHRLSRSKSDDFTRALGTGFAAYMIAVMTVNLFGDRWTYVDLSAYTWILLGLVVQSTCWTQQQTMPSQTAVPAASAVRFRPLVQSV
jgi:hypothetical protein